MKKTKKFSVLIVCLVLMFVAICSAPAFAWLMNKFSTNISVSANIIGSYFEQGDGTEDTPYVIVKPMQLYYFAWLQNLGFFDGENKASATDDKKFYFTLGANIDMSGNLEYSSLPPVGTAEHPFVGVFNGRYHFAPTDEFGNLTTDPLDPDNTLEGTYHTISNVTITNTDLPNIPADGSEGMQYVGLFGVVGSMTDTSVKGEIKNFALDGVTIETKEPIDDKTIIGIVAGYCNGEASGIGVSNCSISVAGGLTSAELPMHTTNPQTGAITTETKAPETFSFSLIGYSDKTYEAYNLSPISGGTEFGGSIMMKDMYDRILEARNTGTSASYYATKTIIIDPQGNRTEILPDETVYRYNVSNRQYELNSNQILDAQGNVVQSYGAIKRYNDTSFTDTVDNFMYLAGGLSVNATRAVTTITQTNDTAYRISDGNGNYLVGSTSTVSATTSSDDASIWKFSNGASGGTIYVNINNRNYYLRNNNGTLSMSTTSTTWTISNGQIKSGNYYLCYDNGWKLTLEASYFTIDNGASGSSKRYLVFSNSSITASANSTTQWHIDSNNRVYTYNGTTKTYLYVYNKKNLRTTTSTNTAGTWTISNGTMSSGTGNNKRYIRYNNGWTVQSSSANITITNVTCDIDNELIQTNWQTITTSNETEQLHTTDTYIPLAANDDGTVSPKNTGYIIGGSNYDYSSTFPGDIRVSYYSISGNLDVALNTNTYSGSNLEVVTRTYLSDGFCRVNDDYNNSNPNNNINSTLKTKFANKKTTLDLGLGKYSDSRTQLHDTLNGATNIYGLHFMDALINIDNTVTIGKATINNAIYYDYKMPQDCIDFNLSTRGYLNFFAGTYFKDNETFFSLHKIERDNAGEMTSIKEISKIYGDPNDSSKDYIYEYVGESAPQLSDGYVLMFDTAWITNPGDNFVDNAMYYFEIPVNEGEYALGSVSGKNGAYLIYLDIGASAKTMGDGTTLETSIKGIDFVTSTSISSANIADTLSSITNETNAKAVIVVKVRFQGTINFVREDYVEDEVDKTRIIYTLSDASAEDYVKWTTYDPDTITVVLADPPDN